MSDKRQSIGFEMAPVVDFGGSRPPILVVDDEVFIASLIAELITEDLQEQAIQVYSAEEAIEELKQGDFSLVISDIRMPGIGGFGLFDWIQAMRPELTHRFLFITGCPGGEEAEESLAHLGVPVVYKPFSCAELIEQCRRVLISAASSEDEVQGRCCMVGCL